MLNFLFHNTSWLDYHCKVTSFHKVVCLCLGSPKINVSQALRTVRSNCTLTPHSTKMDCRHAPPQPTMQDHFSVSRSRTKKYQSVSPNPETSMRAIVSWSLLIWNEFYNKAMQYAVPLHHGWVFCIDRWDVVPLVATMVPVIAIEQLFAETFGDFRSHIYLERWFGRACLRTRTYLGHIFCSWAQIQS